jgi:hypothetical protein
LKSGWRSAGSTLTMVVSPLIKSATGGGAILDIPGYIYPAVK